MTSGAPSDVPDDVDLVTVRLLRLPIPVHARASEHGDALMREFRLIAEQLKGPDRTSVPNRLAELVRTLTSGYSGFTTEQEDALDAAMTGGVDEIDLTYHVPANAAGAALALGILLDEADEYCRAGHHLLTLATPDDLVAYRHWYLGEFVNQIDGAAPTPWSAWAGSTRG